MVALVAFALLWTLIQKTLSPKAKAQEIGNEGEASRSEYFGDGA